MQNKLQGWTGLLATMAMALCLMGCGEWETDPPAPSGTDEEGEEGSEQEEFDETTQEEVRHPFSANASGAEEESEALPEEWEDNSCAKVCVKTLWCADDGGDLETCVNACEEARYSGIVPGRAFDCLMEAEGCVEVGRCEDKIEACTEVCGVYNQCGHFADGVGCHQWCATEVWAGRLDWEVQGCITAAGRADACGDVAECGLLSPED